MTKDVLPVFVAVYHHVLVGLNQVVTIDSIGGHHLQGSPDAHHGLYLQMHPTNGRIYVEVVHQGIELVVDGEPRGTHNNYLLCAFSAHEQAQECLHGWESDSKKDSPAQ